MDSAEMVYLLEGSRAELERWRRDLAGASIESVVRPKADCSTTT